MRAFFAVLALCGATIGPVESALAEAALWAPPNISSPAFESHPAFDPITGDLYFVRSSPQFRGWRILRSRCGANGWTPAEPPPFAGDGVEADPWFTPDGRSLYFISTRTTDGVKRDSTNIWRVDRDEAGRWREPYRLPAPVNSHDAQWFPRLASDGWLYFGSDRPGGFGKTDIWRARQDGHGAWIVENAGEALNSAGDEYEAAPSPDGSKLILMTGDGLFLSEHGASGWSPRHPVDPGLDTRHHEIGVLWSPSGKSLMLSRDLKGERSGELFVWRFDGNEDWPPACPPRSEP